MTELVNYRWEQTIKNAKSQVARGAGAFDPENFNEEDIKRNFVGGMVQKFADPIIETLGWEGQQADNARNFVGFKLLQAFGSNGGSTRGRS